MRLIGVLILVGATLALLVGFNIDTTVASGMGTNRVHNIGLMNEKQNVILLGGTLAVVGAVLFGFGSVARSKAEAVDEGRRECPYCAERIKSDAKVCRYCRREVPSLAELAKNAEESRKKLEELARRDAAAARQAEERLPKGTCPNCEKTIPLASLECKHCGAMFGPQSAWRIRPYREAS